MSDKYVVIGNPIAHSKSPAIHSQFAAQTRQRLEYQTLLAPTDGFELSVHNFIVAGGKGANVTVPFKEQAFSLCTELSDDARLAGAVNTLSFLPDGQIRGDNTDGQGLVADLLSHTSLKHKVVLLIGAGGAARGAILPLLRSGVKQLIISNRTFKKAQMLAKQFKDYGSIIAVPMAELESGFDIIINSTSASLAGDLPGVPTYIFSPDTLCYDMMYGAELTAFNAWAKHHGVVNCIDGLGMLVGQAAISFEIWRGVKPDVDIVLSQLRQALEAK